MISKFVRFADITIILYSFFFIIFYFSGGARKNMIYKYFYIATAPMADAAAFAFPTFSSSAYCYD